MNSITYSVILSFVYGIFMTFLGNKVINFLFKRNRYNLTFPDDMYIRGINRKIFLFILTAITTFFMSLTLKPFALVFALIFASCMIIATRTDIEQRLIFDALLLPYAALGIVAIFAMNLPLQKHLIAAGALFLIMLIFAVISRGGIGGGDVKLLAIIGLWLGEDLSLLTFVLGSIIGGIYSIVLLIASKAGRKTTFPYGPCFTISAIIVLTLYGFQY